MAYGPNPPAIQAHLCVSDGLAAIRFYESAFGGVCSFKQMAQDGRRVLHANIELFGGEVMLHDQFPECAPDVLSPDVSGAASMAINVNLRRPDDVDATVGRAVTAGASITAPVEDQFWGARYGRIRDPFGHIWAFNAPLNRAEAK
ncbi:MAG: VOC family protein [Hyphomicrobiaceae bacterium]